MHSRALPFSVYTAGCSQQGARNTENPSACMQQGTTLQVYTAGCLKSLQFTAGCSKLFRALKYSSVCTQQGAQISSARSRVLRTLQGTEKRLQTLRHVYSRALPFTCTQQGAQNPFSTKQGIYSKPFSMYTCTVTKVLKHKAALVLIYPPTHSRVLKTLQHTVGCSQKKQKTFRLYTAGCSKSFSTQ